MSAELILNLRSGAGRIVKLSCCIPTLNRSQSMARTIRSLCNQPLRSESYEILVVDNGSSDNTRGETESVTWENPHHRIRYILEPEPGLLSGRHRGASESGGEILVFLDDDIEATSGYLHAILDAFQDPAAQLVGGPNLPNYESDPPAWLESFWSTTPYGGRMCVFLSLLDLGGNTIEIHPNYIFGLNFAIRRRALFDLGGFHPDCVPDALQHFQGDGETGLTMKAFAQGFKAVFTPGATVYHFISARRMTPEYFERRAYFQGVCDSYSGIRRETKQRHPVVTSQFRRARGLVGAAARRAKRLYREFRRIPAANQREVSAVNHAQVVAIQQRVQRAYEAGIEFHRDAISRSSELLAWALRPDYWDYRLPLGTNRKTPRAWPMAQQSSGEFASANPTKGEEDARVQECGIRAKISLNPRSHLQHFQCPTPSDISKSAASLQGVGHTGVARSRRRRVTSAVKPDDPASNFQQRDNAKQIDSLVNPDSCDVAGGGRIND